LEVIAVREAGLLARSPTVTAEHEPKTVAALHRICRSPYVTEGVAEEIRRTLEGAELAAAGFEPVERPVLGTINDPRRLPLGFCYSDSFRSYLPVR